MKTGEFTFENRIRSLRLSHRWTQKQVAEKMNITMQAISHYERGVRRPDLGTLKAFSGLFGVSMDYLAGREPGPETPAELRGVLSQLEKLTPEGLRRVEGYISDLNHKYFKEEPES